MRRLKAEWERHKLILLAFPHIDTDWAKDGELKEAIVPFLRLSQAIAYSQSVYILCKNRSEIESLFCSRRNITFIESDFNDTWVRDYGALSIQEDGVDKLLDFRFDGWGGKFEAGLDNEINRSLSKRGYFGITPLESIDFVLEGGSIDGDGEGTILTTSKCLCNPNRNGGLTKGEIEDILREKLGAKRVLWVDSGYLSGDDTDSHIDTLARFVSKDTIVYQSCDNPEDEHYEALKELESQLKSFKRADAKEYNLIPLPFPEAKFDEDGSRLPASYANFLITNSSVIVPTYKDKADKEVVEIFKRLFVGREIIPLDATKLITQGGSIHCSTMQIDY